MTVFLKLQNYFLEVLLGFADADDNDDDNNNDKNNKKDGKHKDNDKEDHKNKCYDTFLEFL